MQSTKIREATEHDFEAVARVWMESWASVGLEPASERLFEDLRARIPREIDNGWSLYVAENATASGSRIVAMLAFRLRDGYLDQLFVGPEVHGCGIGKKLLTFTRKHLPNEIWLRCASKNEKAWRWYEREGFVLEKEEPHPQFERIMRYYRWRK